MRCAIWEKIIYGILGLLLALLFAFHLYGILTYFLVQPVGYDNRLELYKPFRYPYIVLCEPGNPQGGRSDADILAQATMIPSDQAMEALTAVQRWDNGKIQSAWEAIGDLKTKIQGMGPRCDSLVSSAELGGKPVAACDGAVKIVTEFGVCLALNIKNEMVSDVWPVKSLKLTLNPSNGNVKLGVADHYSYFYQSAVELQPSDNIQLGLESLKLKVFDGDYADVVSVEPFQPVSDGINDGRRLNKAIDDRFGCIFAYSNTEDNYCKQAKQIEFAEKVARQYKEGELDTPKLIRNGQNHYKLFSRASHTSADPNIKVDIRYESPYQSVSSMFAVFSFHELFFRIGAAIAIYFTLFMLLFFCIRACKCCCCSGSEKA